MGTKTKPYVLSSAVQLGRFSGWSRGAEFEGGAASTPQCGGADCPAVSHLIRVGTFGAHGLTETIRYGYRAVETVLLARRSFATKS